MRKRNLLTTLLCALTAPTLAATTAEPTYALEDLSQVGSIPTFGEFDRWRELGNDTLIVWTSPSRPYLLKLRRPSHDLRFVQQIGITNSVGRVMAGFDDVLIDGWPYRIESIYKLDRPTAKELVSSAHRKT